MVSGPDFAQIASFMPGIKVLLQSDSSDTIAMTQSGQPQPLARLLCARHESYQRVFDVLNLCSQLEGFALQILIGSQTNKFHKKCIWSAFYQPTYPNDLVTKDAVDRVANNNPMCATAVAKGPALSCNNGRNGISIIWQHNQCNCVIYEDFRLGETLSNKGLRTTLISNEDVSAWVSVFNSQNFDGCIVQYDTNIRQQMLLSASLLFGNISNCSNDQFDDDSTKYHVFCKIYDFAKIGVIGVNKHPSRQPNITSITFGDTKDLFEIFEEQVVSQYKNGYDKREQHHCSYIDVKLEVTDNF